MADELVEVEEHLVDCEGYDYGMAGEQMGMLGELMHASSPNEEACALKHEFAKVFQEVPSQTRLLLEHYQIAAERVAWEKKYGY